MYLQTGRCTASEASRSPKLVSKVALLRMHLCVLLIYSKFTESCGDSAETLTGLITLTDKAFTVRAS